ETLLPPFLEGRTLADPDALRIQFMARPQVYAAADKIYCAGEVGLFDLCANAMGVPLSEVLGGRVRGAIRLYGSAGMYMPPERYAAEAAAIADLGFRAYKMRPAGGPEADLETVRQMRRAVGEDFDLILRQAVDYVQMDVCCQGGFAMGRRLIGEIARAGLGFAFHSWGTALEVIAAAHLGIRSEERR